MHANLVDEDAKNYHLEEPLQEICSKEKIYEIFKDFPNVVGIVDDVLGVGYEVDA